MAYAAAVRAPSGNSLIELATVKYRSIRFSCNPDVKDVDIIRALFVRFDPEDIERVQPMPGAGNWIATFKTSEQAESTLNGFTLLEQRINPRLVAERFTNATVCFVPPDVSLSEIAAALSEYADVIEIKDLYIRDFPMIKNGKQRVTLKPRGPLPSYFNIGSVRASLFFAGRVACCPYCEDRSHLGRDCPRKHQKRCYECGELGHVRRECPSTATERRDDTAPPLPPLPSEEDDESAAEQNVDDRETDRDETEHEGPTFGDILGMFSEATTVNTASAASQQQESETSQTTQEKQETDTATQNLFDDNPEEEKEDNEGTDQTQMETATTAPKRKERPSPTATPPASPGKQAVRRRLGQQERKKKR